MDPVFTGLVPMLPVTDVTRSIAFYALLGFKVGNRNPADEAEEPDWAWLYNAGAHLMLSRTGPLLAGGHEGVTFWVYTKDVAAVHAELAARGLEVGEIDYPFYNPRGEFHVHDPDGYAVFIAHTD